MGFTLATERPKYLTNISIIVEDETLSALGMNHEFYLCGMYNEAPMYTNGYLRLVYLPETTDEETGTVYEDGYYFFEETELIDISTLGTPLTYDEIINGGNN